MLRTFPLLMVALAACSSSALQPVPLDEDPGEIIAGEFIISADLPEALSRQVGLEKVDFHNGLGSGLYRAQSDGVSRAALEATLKQKVRDTIQVENNRPVKLSANDPFRDLQWNMDLLDIETAWSQSTGEGVVVAVIDTGVSFYAQDRPVNLVAGWDYVDNDSDPQDGNGHGTHVAGTIAQATNNGVGVVGMAPDATIVAYRVLDNWGYGSAYWTAAAIQDAADAGVDVINLSLGAPQSTYVERQAVQYAASQGVILVAASGNDGKATVDYPAALPETIAVGAVRLDRQVTSYSNGGQALDLVAPGGDTYVDQNGDGYADGILQETLQGYEFFEGTSMAAPHVAGAAALLLAAGADPFEVRGLLTQTADDLGQPGWDLWSGYGMLNVVAALDALQGSSAPEPEPEPELDTTPPEIFGVGGTRSGSSLTLYWQTDEPATTELEFQQYGAFGDTTSYSTEHELSFTISPSESYYFVIRATDQAGNTSESGTWVTHP